MRAKVFSPYTQHRPQDITRSASNQLLRDYAQSLRNVSWSAAQPVSSSSSSSSSISGKIAETQTNLDAVNTSQMKVEKASEETMKKLSRWSEDDDECSGSDSGSSESDREVVRLDERRSIEISYEVPPTSIALDGDNNIDGVGRMAMVELSDDGLSNSYDSYEVASVPTVAEVICVEEEKEEAVTNREPYRNSQSFASTVDLSDEEIDEEISRTRPSSSSLQHMGTFVKPMGEMDSSSTVAQYLDDRVADIMTEGRQENSTTSNVHSPDKSQRNGLAREHTRRLFLNDQDDEVQLKKDEGAEISLSGEAMGKQEMGSIYDEEEEERKSKESALGKAVVIEKKVEEEAEAEVKEKESGEEEVEEHLNWKKEEKEEKKEEKKVVLGSEGEGMDEVGGGEEEEENVEGIMQSTALEYTPGNQSREDRHDVTVLSDGDDENDNNENVSVFQNDEIVADRDGVERETSSVDSVRSLVTPLRASVQFEDEEERMLRGSDDPRMSVDEMKLALEREELVLKENMNKLEKRVDSISDEVQEECEALLKVYVIDELRKENMRMLLRLKLKMSE